MKNCTPQLGEIYKHYRTQDCYEIVLRATAFRDIKEGEIFDNYMALCDIQFGASVVGYQPTDPSRTSKFVRTEANFCEVLTSDETQEPFNRFQLIAKPDQPIPNPTTDAQ